MLQQKSVLFLGKKDDIHAAKALAYCEANFADVRGFFGAWRDPFPAELNAWKGDCIFSYLSRWIVPDALIARAKLALNFHPGSPDYPGIGCNNFALYENAKEYGSTCHHMDANLDAGKIVAVERCPVFETDTVESLLERTYDAQLKLFYDIVGRIVQGAEFPRCDAQWTRKPRTRRELNALATLTPDMSKDEIARRIRATSFKAWKPAIVLHGYRFTLNDGE
jgi:methionyl-tRNA formyltransferase